MTFHGVGMDFFLKLHIIDKVTILIIINSPLYCEQMDTKLAESFYSLLPRSKLDELITSSMTELIAQIIRHTISPNDE